MNPYLKPLAVILLLAIVPASQSFAQPEAVLNEQRSLLDLYVRATNAEKYEEALDYIDRACKLGERHLLAHPDMIYSMFDLKGNAQGRLQQPAEAAAAYERSLLYAQRSRKVSAEKYHATVQSLALARWNLEDYAAAAKQYDLVFKYRRGALGDRHADTVQSCGDVALCYFHLKDYASAENYYRFGHKQLQAADAESTELPVWLHHIADCRWNQNDIPGATDLYQQAHTIRTRQLGPVHEQTLASQESVLEAFKTQDRTADAEALLKQVVKTCEEQDENSDDVATAVLNLADFYAQRGSEAELEPLYQRVVAIREVTLGKDHSELAGTLHEIGILYYDRGRFAEAHRYHLRGLQIRERAGDTDEGSLGESLSYLGVSEQQLGKFREAETHLRKSRDLLQRAYGPDTDEVDQATLYLAELYRNMGRSAEAVASAQQVLDALVKRHGAQAVELMDPLAIIGNVRLDEGRYAEAEAAFRRALKIQEEQEGADEVDLVSALDNLANVLQEQRQFKDAEALRERALRIAKAHYEAHDPEMARLFNNMASLHEDQGQWEEAEKLYRQALELWETALGKEHADVAYVLQNVARCEMQRGLLKESEAKQRQALAIREATYRGDHYLVAASRASLAEVLLKQGNTKEAEVLIDRAISSLVKSHALPSALFECYVARGELAWKDQRRGEALADMHHAMDLAEQIRGQSGGAEQERAQHYTEFASVFETVLDWQVTTGDASEALSAIERSRARSLLDEMSLSGADITAGNSAADREQLTQRETQLKEQITQLEQQLSEATDADVRNRLGDELDKARGKLYEHYRDQRSSSAVYRQLLAVGGDSLRMSQLQRRLASVEGQLLVYYVGTEGSYVLSLRGNSAKLHALTLGEEQAKLLGVQAGPLTGDTLHQLLMREDGKGIVQQLANPKQAPPVDKLHALWQTLFPAELKAEVVDAKTKRLLIVPDGDLNLLPFEALVVTPAQAPSYLLFAGPPISYAPSATVLYNLYDRQPATRYAASPIVTLGDAVYGSATKGAPVVENASRYGRGGAGLTPLPHTGIEAGWVADVFQRSGVSVDKLMKSEATEANLREHLGQRKIVHLACHGLIDQSYGNFFGALALTAGADAATNPANDGFLTLAEIYALDLRDCELAILSACETNYGPQQSGEGTWALSRGFLVAGSRRVIASNWLVDDQSAASLVSYYCGGLAKAQAEDKTDYAASLQDAKRWLSKQPKWQHPYYWAALVLVGPE